MGNRQAGNVFQSTPAPNEPGQSPSRRAAELVIFGTLVAFLPIPFVVPFWAIAIVPISYLVGSVGTVGMVGLCYGLVAALVVYGISRLLCRLIYYAKTQSTRPRFLRALVLILFVASLLPIYKPGLDPPRPRVNILTLFQHGIPVGQ
jgi:hypothetical protein